MSQSGAPASDPSEAHVARDPATFFALQRLEQGALQQLGDALLPWKFDRLSGLKSNGLSSQGKIRKGVPDSFVGPTVQDCTLAVEYTSRLARTVTKFEDDYDKVRARCTHAREVVLCTNSIVETDERRRLEQRGAADGVRVTVTPPSACKSTTRPCTAPSNGSRSRRCFASSITTTLPRTPRAVGRMVGRIRRQGGEDKKKAG